MLDEISTEQLEKELEQRKQHEKESAVPIPLPEPDWTELKCVCAKYIADLAKDGWADEDYREYVFEAAVEAIYGKNVFDWINKVIG